MIEPASGSRFSRCQEEGISSSTFIGQEDGHCLSEALNDKWEAEIGRSYCQVRPVLVVLNADANHSYHPSVVQVERCAGSCGRTTCVATRTKKRRVQVTRTHVRGTTKCGTVEVLEHVQCDCVDAGDVRNARANTGPSSEAATSRLVRPY
ncbi:hypothetical protein R5R35_000328 [Gryllus longicercus]|uniref:Platelet-derived growth factor (PDGF) family profile domain-containing protein n=1 Tax=Gryllus longicercus TaxID=2509291 RepID=A0AAN9W9C0_9ORTH